MIIAGVDEAGRGPWAGPVVAAAVILPTAHTLTGLTDSKKLTRTQRQNLYSDIMTWCADSGYIGVAASSTHRISQMNILGATLDAMRRAVLALSITPDVVQIDGNRAPDLDLLPHACIQTVIKGDTKIPEISAASIIAKVLRDRIMAKLAARYPVYGWDRNAGYGVKLHKNALYQYGITPHHRKTFKPICRLLETKKNITG